MINVNEKISIKDNIVFLVTQEDEVTVKTPSKLYKLKGEEVYQILIPLIDKLYSGIKINELKSIFADIDTDKAFNIINTLFERGWLTNKKSMSKYDGQVCEENAYKSIGINYSVLKDTLINKNVAIIGFSDIAIKLAESLIDSNIFNIKILIPSNSECNSELINKHLKTISIEYYDCLTENYIEEFIEGVDLLTLFGAIENKVIEESINRICIKNNVAWIRGIVKNFNTQIGPLVIPKYTGCLQCYNDRVYSNLNFYSENIAIDNYVKDKGFSYSEGDEITKPALLIGVGVMNSQIVQYFTKDITWNFPKSIEGVLEYDTYNMNFDIIKFLKTPRCKACNNESINKPTIKSWMEPYNYQEQKVD